MIARMRDPVAEREKPPPRTKLITHQFVNMRTYGSENDSPDDYMERTPPPRRPPPPPPPPRHWILHVRLPNGMIRKIQVDSTTTIRFGEYLQQGLNLNYTPTGLFQGDVYVSLHHILKLRDPQEQAAVFAVEYQPPPPPDLPWWRTLDLSIIVCYGILPISILYYLWNHLELTLLWTGVILVRLADMLIEQPLHHLYHYGPWYLGFWEGEPLPTICARLTYHGDSNFWYRNLSDCQVIFDTKKTAWLQIARPITYALVFGILIYILFLLIREWRKPPPLNRDMVDLYRAFNIILGQVQRRGGFGHHPHDA